MYKTIAQLIASLAIATTLVMAALLPASAATSVPIKASFSGTLAFPDASHIILTGTGKSSHLGFGENLGVVTATGPAACGGFAITSVETLTAANGDELTYTVVGEACPIAPNVFVISSTVDITGGTGRFANADGSGTIECVGDFNTATFEFTLTGTVIY